MGQQAVASAIWRDPTRRIFQDFYKPMGQHTWPNKMSRRRDGQLTKILNYDLRQWSQKPLKINSPMPNFCPYGTAVFIFEHKGTKETKARKEKRAAVAQLFPIRFFFVHFVRFCKTS
jgi:hypothetical protein